MKIVQILIAIGSYVLSVALCGVIVGALCFMVGSLLFNLEKKDMAVFIVFSWALLAMWFYAIRVWKYFDWAPIWGDKKIDK